MLSSKNNEEKFEARFLTRLDVLTERVDSLASTVGTTASGLAKKDGEIAALQRAIETRDQTLLTLVEHANRMAQSPAADVPVDASELRSLRNAVAALTKERADGMTAAQMQALGATVRALDERVGALAEAAAEPPPPHPDTTARLDALAAELADAKTALGKSLAEFERQNAVAEEQVDRRIVETGVRLERLSDRLDSVATQSERLEALAETVRELALTRSTQEEQLDRRLDTTDGALAILSQRLDALADRLETARAVQEASFDQRFTTTNDALAGLSRRLDALHQVDEAGLERRLLETEEALAMLGRRLDTFGETLARLEQARSFEEERLDRRFATTNDALSSLTQRVEGLDSVDESLLDRRLGETDDVVARLTERLDTLAATVESAAAALGDKERELAALQQHFTESSTRIESVVDDIRAALHVLPAPSATSLEDLAKRLQRIEAATREAAEVSVRTAGVLSGRIDLIDQRVAIVADEVSRAKTLWPVALRSLEARLDDAVHKSDDTSSDAAAATEPEDALSGLRDSLNAMETVAAEMARASETLGAPRAEPADDATGVDAHAATPPAPDQASAAAAGGATIVPLRSGEP